jgi:hypothetical protein
MTAPKPKPKPRGGQRRPFARQHSSSKDDAQRFEQQLEDDMNIFRRVSCLHRLETIQTNKN